MSKLFLIFNQFAYLWSTTCFDSSPPCLNKGTCFIHGQPEIIQFFTAIYGAEIFPGRELYPCIVIKMIKNLRDSGSCFLGNFLLKSWQNGISSSGTFLEKFRFGFLLKRYSVRKSHPLNLFRFLYLKTFSPSAALTISISASSTTGIKYSSM